MVSLYYSEIGAVLSLSLMPVALLGWCGRQALTSLTFLGLANAADFPDHLFLRHPLLGDLLLLGFPNCHVASSVNESG